MRRLELEADENQEQGQANATDIAGAGSADESEGASLLTSAKQVAMDGQAAKAMKRKDKHAASSATVTGAAEEALVIAEVKRIEAEKDLISKSAETGPKTQAIEYTVMTVCSQLIRKRHVQLRTATTTLFITTTPSDTTSTLHTRSDNYHDDIDTHHHDASTTSTHHDVHIRRLQLHARRQQT